MPVRLQQPDQAGTGPYTYIALGPVPPTRRAMKIIYGVACSTCGAGPDEHCKTLDTGIATHTHKARLEALQEARR